MSRSRSRLPLKPLLVAALCGVALAVPVPLAAPASAQEAAATKPVAEAQVFASAAEAAKALIEAAKAQDKAALIRILGADGADIVNSGDEVADRKAMEDFARAAAAANGLTADGDGRYTLVVGAQNWPMPIPIVKRATGWAFDVVAGRDEILNRRVGENELTAIQVMRAFVAAQRQYAAEPREADGLKKYARRIRSNPGRRDGLYWEAKEGEAPSPMGALVAEAESLGYRPGYRLSRRGQPYFGYYFKLLAGQGPAAPGGRYSYVVNGNMIAGFAMVAYPAQWGNSGVMTFVVSHHGAVYQRNLGPRTAEIAANLVEYNPDANWQVVKD